MSERRSTQDLEDELSEAEQDATNLVADLSEERGRWRPKADAWSVAECLDHLAIINRVYLRAMETAASRAKEQERERSPAGAGAVRPGMVGRWLVRTMEPPVKTFRMKSPPPALPRTSPPLADAFSNFLASQNEVRAFLLQSADLNLNRVRFDNPFLKGVRFSLATGLHIIAAHERRHLWQAWRVRASYPAA